MIQTLFLVDFSVLVPDPGLIFWTSLVFIVVYFLLSRVALKPIQSALKDRENSIQESLDEAKKAREEMKNLKAENEALIKQAQEERTLILREAKEMKDNIINEAKEKAKEEAQRIVASAKNDIENKRLEMMTNVKNQMGLFAVEIAEKLTRKEIAGKADNEKLVNSLIDEIKLN